MLIHAKSALAFTAAGVAVYAAAQYVVGRSIVHARLLDTGVFLALLFVGLVWFRKQTTELPWIFTILVVLNLIWFSHSVVGMFYFGLLAARGVDHAMLFATVYAATAALTVFVHSILQRTFMKARP